MSDTAFIVRASDFEGPLELLLELIENRKMSINQVSLAAITEEYIHFLEAVGVHDRESLSHFITVAATLMLIKSRTLLPGLALTEEEEGNIDDLERRLRAYAEIRECTKKINELYNVTPRFGTKRTPTRMPVFTPDQQTDINILFQLASTLISAIPMQEILPEAKVSRSIDIRDVMESLMNRIRTQMNTSFAHLVETSEIKERKISIVIHFLALLELMKLDTMDVSQDVAFNDILIQTHA